MKVLFKVKTKTGIEGTISIISKSRANNVANFRLDINDKQIGVFGIILLNSREGTSYITLDEKETKQAFGKAIKARLEIISFADGSAIPTGNIVQINNLFQVNNDLDIEDIRKEIGREKKRKPVKKYRNLPQDSYSRMMREGFDSIEN